MELTKEQQLAYQQLDWFVKSDKKYFLLSGFAGTGKTTTIGTFISEFCSDYTFTIAAPTHKALRILLSKLKTNVQFGTLHSLLNLTQKINGYGKQVFVKNQHAPNKLEGVDILIVDECSTVTDELFNYLMKYRNMKIIFLGDYLQIPPVKINKEKDEVTDSLLFFPDIRKKYKIGHTNLTEIIRQKEGNGIIDLSIDIRKNIKSVIDITKLVKPSDNVKLIKHKPIDSIVDIIHSKITSDEYKTNKDFYKIITWTNKKAEFYNGICREIYFDQSDLPKIMVGDLLVISTPVIKNKEILLNTNDEVLIQSSKVETSLVDGCKIQHYTCFVKDHDNYNLEIKILHEESEKLFNTIVQKYYLFAKEKQQGTMDAVNAWTKYHNMKNKFVNFKYSYAITAHCSQGSTYTDSMIIEHDIKANPNVYERNRILYTAITRAENNIEIIH